MAWLRRWLCRCWLVREVEWDAYILQRERSQEIAEAESNTEALDTSEEADAQSSGSGGVEVNGVLVPQLILDRSKAALERFGVTR